MRPTATSVPDGLRQRKKASTDARLRRTALRLFKAKGFDEVSVDEIARQAEVSRSTFFRYFGSKEAVLFDEVDESTAAFMSQLQARPVEEGPLTAFEEALIHTAEETGRNRSVDEQKDVLDLLRNDPALSRRRLQQLDRSTEQIAQIFAARRGREVADFSDRLAAVTCMGLSEELSRLWRADPAPDPPALIRAAFAELRRLS